MKFLVVGHLCQDVIHTADGREITSYGGIVYAVTALATLMEKGDRVLPVFGVNAGDYEHLIAHLSRYPGIDTSGIFRFDAPTNRVHLFYTETGTRTECSTHIAVPVPFERIRPSLSVDGILINMISGFDITVDTLDQIRMAVRQAGTPLHFDYHSLTLGVTAHHTRFRRPVEEWRRWAFMNDTVQCNEEELGGLTVDSLSEEQTVGHLFTLGVKGVVVTRGERGATLFRSERKRTIRNDIAGVSILKARDTTGCGDVFGAAFLLRYAREGDLLAAAQFANRVAARKAELEGDAAMPDLKTVLEAS